MSEFGAGSAAEFIPNQREITLARKIKRIDDECSRRIQRAFPLQDQVNILVSMLAESFGFTPGAEIRGVSSQAYVIAKDRGRVVEYVRCVIEHRHAAEALKLHAARNLPLINSIDVSLASHWPAETRKALPDDD